MDEIQKILIKAGRKDLAQKYFLRTAISPSELKKYVTLINRVKSRSEFGKLQVLIDNFNLRRNDATLTAMVDNADESPLDANEFTRRMKQYFVSKPNLPAIILLKRILDFGFLNGYTKLSKLLRDKRIKATFSRAGVKA